MTIEDVLTMEQVAEELGISARSVRKYCQAGELGFQPGTRRSYIITRQSLDEFKARPRKGPGRPQLLTGKEYANWDEYKAAHLDK